MSYHRQRGSKRLQFHGTGGRFAKAPSLEAQGLIKVCEHCGQIVPRPAMRVAEQTGFVDPKVPWPTECPGCKEKLP